MTDVPTEPVTERALDAAMTAAPDQHISLGHWEPAIRRADMRKVLEAAAPHMAAVIEERFAAAAREELAKPLADLGAQIATEATAAERKRIRSLAAQVDAYYIGPCEGRLPCADGSAELHTHHRVPFASLLDPP